MIISPLTPQQAARNLSSKALTDGFKPQSLHPYTDLQGNILYWRIRLKHPDGRKWIRPMYQDKNGQYHLGEPPELSDKLKPLYGLHLLNRYPDATVIIVEGEYPADILNRFFDKHEAKNTYIAITSGSATSVDSSDWQALNNRNILMWPDNDAPGKEYAKQVSEKITAIGNSWNSINIGLLSLSDGGDCVDWLLLNPTAKIADIQALHNSEINHLTADDSVIAQLATLSPLQYDRIRLAESKKLKIRPATLDKMVNAIKNTERSEVETPFSEIEPWHEPVNAANLLNEIVNIIHRFIICSPETAHATALWATMTWFIDVIQVAPLAVITAPEKRCGKSQLLFLLGRIVNRPLMASNITPAALFRSIDAWQPSLLIDEADAFMRENEELRGLLNCGHTRDSAYTVRVVGDDHTPKTFFVWGAKALAGIGHLADTLMDRAITLELRRKLPNEKIDRLRHAEPELFTRITAKLARFSQDFAEQVQKARPMLPDALNDRAQDNWEPLFAIAEVAGENWLKLARTASLKLSGKDEQHQSISIELLADIQDIFENKNTDRISSADLIKALCFDEEKPWATYNRGLPIKPRQIATRLKEFRIISNTIRIGLVTAKGYMKSQFDDAFARYLINPLVDEITTSQVPIYQNNHVTDTLPVTDKSVTSNAKVTCHNPINNPCDVVTDIF